MDVPMEPPCGAGLRTCSAGVLPALERASARCIAAGMTALLRTGRQVAISRCKRPEDGCALFERQGFGAHRRLDSGFLQGLLQRLRSVLRLQIIPQCLALLSERKL